ncbi:PhzF family phenazine biosynthesis protein [Shewanella cyperi]|uniref:PhzF family phenazine biosynthesis protein n=1 Tax=Shewanella cyperi TaxID=2814292 RepID=UPI001A94D523|nr:PhzF family phenazine biosynthesis protein [Shewanella cyperi]QSX40566.1 PhzF family phenazine biosynthesis protein [Shewanella cyperi]
MKCELVDVFAKEKLQGNGLTIFSDCDALTTEEMQAWTREMRQFESIFLQRRQDGFHVRIFTVEEELDFAGHPLLGLALHLHQQYGTTHAHDWLVHTKSRPIHLSSREEGGEFIATMDQGKPEYLRTLTDAESEPLYAALSLSPPGNPALRAEVISTGLPYVILPVESGLDKVSFQVRDLTPLLAPLGAKFLYLLDVVNLEGRTWDNQGLAEDVATGSAAGPVAAFLYKQGRLDTPDLVIKQGRFLGRPSEIKVQLELSGPDIATILVSAKVVKVADIQLLS